VHIGPEALRSANVTSRWPVAPWVPTTVSRSLALAQGNGTGCGEGAAACGEAARWVPAVVDDDGGGCELPQAPIASAPSTAKAVWTDLASRGE
jgi:hypothetical protein